MPILYFAVLEAHRKLVRANNMVHRVPLESITKTSNTFCIIIAVLVVASAFASWASTLYKEETSKWQCHVGICGGKLRLCHFPRLDASRLNFNKGCHATLSRSDGQ